MREPLLVNPTREEWLQARQRYVTATQVASLLGVNKFMTGEQLRQQFDMPDEIDQNSPYLLAGHKWEPEILSSAAKLLNVEISAQQSFYTLEDHSLAATPDAITSDERIIEAKATNYNNHKYWEESPPLNYLAQVHTQLLTTGAKEAFIAGMFFMDWPEEPKPIMMTVYKITKNEEVEKKILDSVERFWYAFKNDEPFKSKNVKDIKELLKSTASKVGGQGYMEAPDYVLDPKQMVIMRQTIFKAALKKGVSPDKLLTEFYRLMDIVQDGSRDTLIMVGSLINAWADSELPLEAFHKTAREGLLFILSK